MNNEDLFYINLGICYQNENQDIKAIDSFKKISKDSKFYTESQVQIGKSLSKLQELDELEDLIKQQSDNTIRSSLLTFAAEEYYEQQNLTKSLECYKSAINLNPENYDALTGTAELYLKEQKYDEGFDYWRWRVRKGLKLNKRFFVDDTEIITLINSIKSTY
jgi:tetratricopeptide (TPR) repeat protein